MKQFLFLLVGLSIIGFSCKKKSKNGSVSIVFKNTIDGLPIEKDKLVYSNAAGNKYSVSLLKYYITNAVLVQEDGTEYKLNNYDLIDEFDKPNFSTIEAGNIPGGHYTKLKFYVGLDKIRNHEGAQDGDLDPLYNMIWTWNTGYIFLKHEGQLITPTNDTVVMQYHIATDDALRKVELPIHLTVEGNPVQLNLQFDLNKIYNAPVVDINTQPIMHSTAASDKAIMNAVADNYADAFMFTNTVTLGE
jgi:hypothetical protein